MASRNITRGVLIDSEKAIDKWLREQVKKRKGKYIKLQTDLEAGLPDRLVLLQKGFTVFLELKSTGDEARMLQLAQHGKLFSLGQTVKVIDTLNKDKKFINDYDNAI